MSFREIEEEEKIELEDLPTKDEGFDIYENHQGCFCTDFYCLIIFILALIAVLVFFIVGFKQGNPKKLVAPLSGEGEFCGLDNRKQFPYLYLPKELCVNSCPSSEKRCIHTDGSITDSTEDACTGDGIVEYAEFPYNDTIAVLYRCVPNLKEYLQSTSAFGSFSDFFTILVNDIRQGWWVFLVVFFLTILLSVICLCFVRFCAKCIIWGSIIACIVVVFALGLLLLIFGIYSYSSQPLKTDRTSSVCFIAFGGVFLATACTIALITCCCLRRQIGLAAGVVTEASRALGDIWSVYFSPLFYLVLFALAVVAFATTLVYFCSGVEIDTTGGEKTLKLKTSQRVVVLFAFFIFLWVTAFLIGCNQATIAGAASAWYFTRRKELLVNFIAGASAAGLFFHHVGSIAVGSFLIALVYFVRAAVLYLQQKMSGEIRQSRVAQCLCGCLSCCLACLSRVLEFITSNAYIVMSIYGEGFFSSASTAMKLLARNPARSLVFAGVSRFIVVCLELLVTAVVTVVAVVILKPSVLGIQKSLDIYYWWFLAFACFLFALVLSVFVFHIYSFLLKVIFMCFLLDEELSHKKGGSGTRFASTNLAACMDDYDDVAVRELESQSSSSSSSGSSSSYGGYSSSKPTSSAGKVDV